MRISVHEKQETELSKLAKAYVKAVSGEDAVPDTVTMVSKTPIDDDGSVLIEFEFTGNGPKSTGGTTYALVYGDLYTNTDKDLLYFLHDWQSGEKVTPEDIGEHDWELANDYIRPSDILSEAFGSFDDMLTKDEQKIVLDAYNDALKEALTYIQGALPEGYTTTQLSFGNPFYTTVGTERADLDRYDPDRFGPRLLNAYVDFIDGDAPKVAFCVDFVDHGSAEPSLKRKEICVDPFVEDFLAMQKPAFRLLPSDADKIADATKRAFRKAEDNEAKEYKVNVAFTPEPPFGYGDQDFLFKGLDIVDEEFSFPTRDEAEDFAVDCANRMTARNQDLESDGLQDGEIRVYYTNRDYVDRMVRNAGKAFAALWQDYDPENPPFPVLVARIGITRE